MDVVYHSFEGRYSDNPRAICEAWRALRPHDTHTWLALPAYREQFPPHVRTVPPRGAECVAALESADLVIANTHTDVDWCKPPEAVYLQTWHGTPLKRVHFDVLWAPDGRLQQLTRDVDRWDILLSPNTESTPRLRGAFGFAGEVLESGYPRNDVLLSSDRDEVRRRVREQFGIAEDVTAVLYTPTWRDDAVYAPGDAPIELALDAAAVARRLGEGFCLLVRVHAMQSDRHSPRDAERVRDVSGYAEIAELYLAADVMVTDYSSTMFDFAVTGKPMIFFTYDLARFRDEVRGFYFDLEDAAPGPLVDTEAGLITALEDRDGWRERFAERYAHFQARYCHLEDGAATQRVLERLWKR